MSNKKEKKIALRIEQSLFNKLILETKKRGVGISEVVRYCLKKCLDKTIT